MVNWLFGLNTEIIIGVLGAIGIFVANLLGRRTGRQEEKNKQKIKSLKTKVKSKEIEDEVYGMSADVKRDELDKWMR